MRNNSGIIKRQVMCMRKNFFQKTPLWDWNYRSPGLSRTISRIDKNIRELDTILAESEKKGKKVKKK